MPTEADTCRTYIVSNLHTAGWEDVREWRGVAPVLWADADAENVDSAFKGEL